jgi:hypothetical protein
MVSQVRSPKMCDYSLHRISSQPPKVGDKLTIRDFGTGTRGLAAAEPERTCRLLCEMSALDHECPLMAHSRQRSLHRTCLLLTQSGHWGPTLWGDCPASPTAAARAQFGCVVCITSSRPSSSSGTKPLPPQVGHCRSSSVPFSMTPSPLQSGQVFMCAPHENATAGRMRVASDA